MAARGKTGQHLLSFGRPPPASAFRRAWFSGTMPHIRNPCCPSPGNPPMRSRRLLLLLPLLSFVPLVLADGPQDNIPDKVRRVPPPGVEVPKQDRDDLQAGVEALGKDIDALRDSLKGKQALLDLVPDVEVFHSAVKSALKYDEFYKAQEV